MADLFPSANEINAQAPSIPASGLFGENQAAQLAANRLAVQRMQALQQAQLSPEANGAFMAVQAGQQLGQGLGAALGGQPPVDPMQLKLMQVKKAVDAEGLTDPEQYLRMAASKLVEAGLYSQALEAQKQADNIAKNGVDRQLKQSQAQESLGKAAEARANSVESLANVGKTQQTVSESQALLPYKVAIEKAKATMTDPASIKLLAEADKATNESDMVKSLAAAHIEQMKSEAVRNQTLTQKETKQTDYELMGTLFDEKGKGTITPAREALLNAMIDIKSKPQTVVNSIMGGNKTADTFMNPGAAPAMPAVPSVKQPAGKAIPAGIPAGSKMIGTAGGKPVYQTPDGRRLIVK